jgi:hypothetical protein
MQLYSGEAAPRFEQPVILHAPDRIREHFVSLLDLPEERWRSIQIRVNPENQLAIPRFDIDGRGSGRQAQDVVVAVISHSPHYAIGSHRTHGSPTGRNKSNLG